MNPTNCYRCTRPLPNGQMSGLCWTCQNSDYDLRCRVRTAWGIEIHSPTPRSFAEVEAEVIAKTSSPCRHCGQERPKASVDFWAAYKHDRGECVRPQVDVLGDLTKAIQACQSDRR